MKKFNNFDKSDYMKNISESRYKSHGLKHIKTQLDKILKKYSIDYKIEYLESEEIFILEINNLNKNTLDFILSRSEIIGFYPSVFRVNGDDISTNGDIDDFITHIKQYNLPKENSIFLQFESWLDEPIQVPNKIYHVCKNDNLEKIMRYGLTPRAKHKISKHPERIYVVGELMHALDIMKQLKISDDSKYNILEITPSDDILFRKDPNYKVGSYTTQNIPPNTIKKLI